MNPKELLELLKGRGYKGIPTGCTEETITVFLENDLENVFRAFYGTYLWKQELKEAEEEIFQGNIKYHIEYIE